MTHGASGDERIRTDTAERNPIGLAVGAAAVGFVAGLLIPSTKVENERMGEMSDRLVDAAKETAGDAVERGKQVAQEAAETAKDSGREQSQERSEVRIRIRRGAFAPPDPRRAETFSRR